MRDDAPEALAKIGDRLDDVVLCEQHELAADGLLPPWLGDHALHRSHQSSLVRKDPAHYRRFFPDVPDDLPYVWPVPEPAS